MKIEKATVPPYGVVEALYKQVNTDQAPGGEFEEESVLYRPLLSATRAVA